MPAKPLRAIIHVDMDAFYASVEQRDEPAYRGQPVIVGGTGPRGVVAAASYEARAFGVFSAMPAQRARRLCPDGIFLRPRLPVYREVSATIFAIFREFTPWVEGLSLDEAFLDVSASLRLFGTLEDTGRLLRDRIEAETGLPASVGMAHNKLLAKLASEVGKPRGFVCIAPKRVASFLDPMPVARLWGVGRKTAARLQAIGILTIGQLRVADASLLQGVLGRQADHFLRLARGEDERAVTPERADKSISQEMTFDTDITDPRELHAILQGQAEDVARRLRGKALAARTVQIKIRDRHFHTETRRRSLRFPSASTRTIYRLASALLDTWLATHANTPVRLLGVGVSGLEQPETAQGPIDRLTDAIAERHGADKITRALALGRKRR